MRGFVFKIMLIMIMTTTSCIVIAQQSNVVQSIEVFTLAGMPPTNVPDHAIFVELDEAGRLDALISENLPDDPQRAMAYMQTLMRSDQWQHLTLQLKHAYTGLARAKQLGIDKVPAVVIDSQYVIYGVTNIEEALRMYHDYHKEYGR